jgi:hypothetical protein
VQPTASSIGDSVASLLELAGVNVAAILFQVPLNCFTRLHDAVPAAFVLHFCNAGSVVTPLFRRDSVEHFFKTCESLLLHFWASFERVATNNPLDFDEEAIQFDLFPQI